ncbi:MAG: LysE family transporter [bacterium]
MTELVAALLLGILSGTIGSVLVAGPISILVVSRIAQGHDREGLSLAAGAAVAEGTYAALAGLGAKLLVGIEGATAIGARALGAVLLLSLGALLVRTSRGGGTPRAPRRQRTGRGFWLGFMVAALNPALAAGWAAAITALVSWGLLAGGHIAAVVFGTGVSVGVMLWFSVAITGLRGLREKVRPTTALKVRQGTGAILIAIGLVLAIKVVWTELF